MDGSLVLNQSLQQLIGELKNFRANNSATEQVEGSTEVKDVETLAIRFYSELTDPLKDLCEAILGAVEPLKNLKEDLGSTIADAAGNMAGGSNEDSGGGWFSEVKDAIFGKDKKAFDPGNMKNKPQPNNLMKVDPNQGLGFLLLYWKLDEMSKKMGDGKEKNKKGGGLGDLFKGLLQGATGLLLLAAALLIFGAALVLFGIVKWDAALFGMLAFTLFVIGAMVVAKLVKKSMDDFVAFTTGVIILAGGLAIFTIALIIASFALQFIPKALVTLVLYAAFIVGVLFVANAIKANIEHFKQFAIGSVILAGGLAIFAIAIIIASFAFSYIPKALLVLVLYALFVVGVVLLANLMKQSMKDFMIFSIATVIMIVGLVLFTLAILLMSKVTGKMMLWALAIIGMMLVMMILFAVLGYVIALGGGPIPPILGLAILAAAAVLMSIALILFSAALLIMSKIEPETLIIAAMVLGLMAVMVLGFAAIGFAAMFTIPWIAIASVAVVLISMSLLLFALMLKAIQEVGDPDVLNQVNQHIIPGLKEVLTNFSKIEITRAQRNNIIRVGQAAKPVIEALEMLTTTVKELNNIAKDGDVTKAIEAAGFLFTGVLSPLLDKLVVLAENFSGGSSARKAMVAIAEAAGPLASSLGSLVGAVKDMVELLEGKPTEDGDGNPISVKELLGRAIEGVNYLFESILEPIIVRLADKAGEMSNRQANRMKTVTESMSPVTDAIASIVGSVEKAGEFDHGKMNKARDNIFWLFYTYLDAGGPFMRMIDNTEIASLDRETITGIGNLKKIVETFAEISEIASESKMGQEGSFAGIKELSDGINEFQINTLRMFADNVQRIALIKNLGTALEPLVKITDKVESFDKLTASIDRAATSIEKLTANLTLLKQLQDMDGGSSINIGEMREQQQGGLRGAATGLLNRLGNRGGGGTSEGVDGALKHITSIMATWVRDGIKIDEATMKRFVSGPGMGGGDEDLIDRGHDDLPGGPDDISNLNDVRGAGYVTEGGFVSSKYGPRTIGGRNEMHNGVDIAGCPVGSPIRALAAGTVVRALTAMPTYERLSVGVKLSGGEGNRSVGVPWLDSRIWGNMVEIRHDGGHQTLYSHLDILNNIKVGQKVKRGEIIGTFGNTGRSTGPHLHFEIRRSGGGFIDPNQHMRLS